MRALYRLFASKPEIDRDRATVARAYVSASVHHWFNNQGYVDALVVDDALKEWRVRLSQRGAFHHKKGAFSECAARHSSIVNDLVVACG